MGRSKKILIADSGATKTDWCLSGEDGYVEQFSTEGINPFFRTAESIIDEWQNGPLVQLIGKVERLFFYGAGVVNDEKAQIINKALSHFFSGIIIEVESDLVAAARATLGNMSGIACILGTGSNSCQYNGTEITMHVPPLGYILGDEGSGAYLGRRLVADYLKKIMPGELSVRFREQYRPDYFDILSNVYHRENPNRFLAGFVPFIKENIEKEYCINMVKEAFDAFISRNVIQYSGFEKLPVCFVGSVAFYFQEQLEKVLHTRDLIPGVVIKEPLLKLIQYHVQE